MPVALLAWPGAIAIGVSLGLLGSGGSIITGLGIAGSFLRARIARKMPQQRLKQGFGYFLVVMGLYILVRTAPDVLQVFTAN